MNEHIRETGNHWWEKLEGMRYGLAVTGTRTCYGLISGGELVCVLLGKHGAYSIGYYLCHGTEDGDFKICSPSITATVQTIPGAMREAEVAYLSFLTENIAYYDRLLEKYMEMPTARMDGGESDNE